METSIRTHRAVVAGISGGVGVALPLAAAAATIPFGDAAGAVRTAALPFAVGALSGVGLFALSDYLEERRSERLSSEAAQAAAFSSIFDGGDAAEPHTVQQASAPAAGVRLAGRAVPKGVPVISRAVDALDEADAWAEIDAMLDEDSPISCDPSRSKDIYEIALEELRHADRARSGRAAEPQTASISSARASAAPCSTDAFLALAAAGSASPSPRSAAAPARDSVASTDCDDAEERSARDAALASLYGVDLKAVPVATPAPSDSPAPAAVADYSGHEAIWAAALAILAEDAPVASPSQTASLAPDRMAAVAEGAGRTRDHNRVNALMEEEFEQSPSSSARLASREYLRVIRGGTASLPRLRARA